MYRSTGNSQSKSSKKARREQFFLIKLPNALHRLSIHTAVQKCMKPSVYVCVCLHLSNSAKQKKLKSRILSLFGFWLFLLAPGSLHTGSTFTVLCQHGQPSSVWADTPQWCPKKLFVFVLLMFSSGSAVKLWFTVCAVTHNWNTSQHFSSLSQLL